MRNLPMLMTFGMLIALCGCRTNIDETHLMQSRTANGKIAYYRVTVTGKANLSKIKYRAGMYNAAALDSLTTAIESGDNLDGIDQAVARQQKAAAEKIAKKYYEALAEGSNEVASVYYQNLQEALKSPYQERKQKFAIIYSANASEVENAIAEFVEAKETQDQLIASVASMKRSEYLTEKADADRIDANISILQSVRDQIAQTNSYPTNAVAFAEFVRRMYKDVSSLNID